MQYKHTKKARICFSSLVDAIHGLIHSEEYKDRSRKRAEDFTRSRKMPFVKMMFFMLNQIKSSTQTALDRFFDLMDTGGGQITQQSFSEARQKLKWQSCRELAQLTANCAYEGGYSTWHGYRVSAIDGTKVQLPADTKLKEMFGTVGRGDSAPTAQASCLYDVLNSIILAAEIAPVGMDERLLAQMHIAELGMMPSSSKELVILDRGYPSFDLAKAFGAAGISFLMRVRRKFSLEIDALPLGDGEATLSQGGESIRVRIVKFVLPGGETETLMTDLADRRMGVDAFKKLYFLRWPIETKYGDMKHRLEVENFSGRTVDAVFQDFYVSVFLSNVISVAAAESQPVIDAAMEGKGNKYEYQVNTNHAVGVFKDRFIMALAEPDTARRDIMLDRIMRMLYRRVTPIRPGRSVPRNQNPRKANFHFNQKSNC